MKRPLKILPCGHLIDYECFDELMNNGFICKIDKKSNLDGYLRVLSKEKVEEIK